MKLTAFLLILYLLLAIPTIASCQKQQFNAGIVAGLNNTPVLFYQYGINAGLFATTRISEKHGFRLELLLTQNGDNSILEDLPEDRTIYRAYYVETPVYFDWKWTVLKEQVNFDVDILYSLGLAYSRGVAVHVEEINNNDTREKVRFSNKNAVLFKSGLIFLFAKRFGLNINMGLPIRKTDISPSYAFRLLYLLRKS